MGAYQWCDVTVGGPTWISLGIVSTELASSRHERVGLREGDEIENLDDSVVEIVVCIDSRVDA